jgi:hypothetical protein
MKKKILVFSMAILVCSFSNAEAVGLGKIVDAYADIDVSSWEVSGASTYAGDFYFNQSIARTASVWDITTQPDAVPVLVYYADETFIQSDITVDENVLAKATGETGIDEFGVKFIASHSNVQLMPGLDGHYSAEASAWRGQAYEVTTAGAVTFSIDYVLDVVYGEDAMSNYGVAMAWIHLRQYDHASGGWSNEVLLEDFLTIEGVGSTADTLSLSYTFNSIDSRGTYILFEAGADTRVALLNPVPVPPSVLMLLTGCTSLFFLKRRKS